MTTAPLEHTDVIVLDYLAALWAQSEDLAPELRDELMTTVADYIALRRTSPSSPIDDPAEILPPHLRLPALIPPPPPAATGGGAAQGGAAEYTAIGLMTAGAFVMPGLGPFAGMLMASASPRWTPAEKATGWFLTIGSGTAAIAAGMFFILAGTAGAAALLFCYMLAVGGSLFAGMRMLDALRRR
jgi:hypothetical protein